MIKRFKKSTKNEQDNPDREIRIPPKWNTRTKTNRKSDIVSTLETKGFISERRY